MSYAVPDTNAGQYKSILRVILFLSGLVILDFMIDLLRMLNQPLPTVLQASYIPYRVVVQGLLLVLIVGLLIVTAFWLEMKDTTKASIRWTRDRELLSWRQNSLRPVGVNLLRILILFAFIAVQLALTILPIGFWVLNPRGQDFLLVYLGLLCSSSFLGMNLQVFVLEKSVPFSVVDTGVIQSKAFYHWDDLESFSIDPRHGILLFGSDTAPFALAELRPPDEVCHRQVLALLIEHDVQERDSGYERRVRQGRRDLYVWFYGLLFGTFWGIYFLLLLPSRNLACFLVAVASIVAVKIQVAIINHAAGINLAATRKGLIQIEDAAQTNTCVGSGTAVRDDVGLEDLGHQPTHPEIRE
jgi:hypothetical protein